VFLVPTRLRDCAQQPSRLWPSRLPGGVGIQGTRVPTHIKGEWARPPRRFLCAHHLEVPTPRFGSEQHVEAIPIRCQWLRLRTERARQIRDMKRWMWVLVSLLDTHRFGATTSGSAIYGCPEVSTRCPEVSTIQRSTPLFKGGIDCWVSKERPRLLGVQRASPPKSVPAKSVCLRLLFWRFVEPT
jgi:hypothetical protein